ELSDNDLITRRQLTSKRARQMQRERCHVRAERYLLSRSIQKISYSLTSIGEHLISLGTRRIGPLGIRVVMIEIIHHRISYRARNLSSTRPIEVRDRKSVVNTLESRKVRADLFDRRNSTHVSQECRRNPRLRSRANTRRRQPSAHHAK